MAKLGTEYKLPPQDFKDWKDIDNQPHFKEMDRLLQISQNLPEGELVGYILRFPRADGYAFYVVSNIKPLTLRHIDYGDNWRIDDAHIRGLRLQDVKSMQHSDRELAKIFGSR